MAGIITNNDAGYFLLSINRLKKAHLLGILTGLLQGVAWFFRYFYENKNVMIIYY